MSGRRRARPSHLAGLVGAAVFAMVMAWAPPAASRRAVVDAAAEGRKHAERASHLAASGKCRQALGEYDKAIAVLHDPTLLFNRGECHRKLGNAESALEDYNQFLSDLPNAPNRAQVETRIAELRAQKAGNDAGSAASATAAARGVSGVDAPVPVSTPEQRKPAVGLAPSAAAEPPPRLNVAPPPTAGAAPLAVVMAPAEPGPRGASSSSNSLGRRPLFWVALGVVLVGAGVGAYFVLGRDPTNIPRSDLGNYRF